MTSRNRILLTMQGKPTDRVPVAPFVHSSTVAAWMKDPGADAVTGTIQYCKHFGFDIIHRNFAVRHSDFESAENWDVRVRRQINGDETLVTTRISTPGGCLQQTESIKRLSPYKTVSAQAECLIKNMDDFELFRRYAPAPVPPDFSDLQRVRALLGEDGVLAPWVSGVFNYMAHLRPLEDLLMDPLIDPGFYAEFASFALARLTKAMADLLREGMDLLSYAGNLAGGTMAGPSYFNEHVLRFEKELVDFIQSRCLGVIYHNCGDADNMIGCYNRLMPVCYESMTEPPFADNSLEKSLRDFDPAITLIGNIDQIDFLKNASPEAVTRKARQILDAAFPRKRFILGTSDLLEEGTPDENLLALARSVR